MGERGCVEAVTGAEFSPVQLYFVPPNCHFVFDHIEYDWVYDKQYDHLH